MEPVPVTSLSPVPSTGSGFRGGDPSFIQQAYSKCPYVPGLFQILKIQQWTEPTSPCPHGANILQGEKTTEWHLRLSAPSPPQHPHPTPVHIPVLWGLTQSSSQQGQLCLLEEASRPRGWARRELSSPAPHHLLIPTYSILLSLAPFLGTGPLAQMNLAGNSRMVN